jgi:hypothetical protein
MVIASFSAQAQNPFPITPALIDSLNDPNAEWPNDPAVTDLPPLPVTDDGPAPKDNYPYILGGVPSLADYGMMGALYAHLARDVSSGNKMKVKAPALFRWTETMLRPPVLDPERWSVPQEFFSIGDLPETLVNFLKVISEDYVPEYMASIDLYHQWLDAEPRPAGATVDVEGAKRCHQALGQLEHTQHGIHHSRIGLLDNVMHHVRFQDLTRRMNDDEMSTLRGVLRQVGAEDLADLRLKRDIERKDFAWVLV